MIYSEKPLNTRLMTYFPVIVCYMLAVILPIFTTIHFWSTLESELLWQLRTETIGITLIFIFMLGCCVLRVVAHKVHYHKKSWPACLMLTLLASIPLIFLYILIKGSTFLPAPERIVTRCLLSSLLPLGVVCIWHFIKQENHPKLSIKPVLFTLIPLSLVVVFFEFALYLILGPVKIGFPSVNAPDKTYWHFKPHTVQEREGQVIRINSWGIRGPEPESLPAVTQILLIGDSLPFGSTYPEEKVFPWLAGHKLNKDQKTVEVINASIPSFSLEQIKSFYLDKVSSIPHDILILCFYLDDVNRELKYKKNNMSYMPTWPEWIQDIFYSTHILNSLMKTLGYKDTTFSQTRRLTYDEAWPFIYKKLNALKQMTDKKGVMFAVLNVPRFDWQGTLGERNQYQHITKNNELEKWCKENNIPYHDTLPMFLNVDIDSLRQSPLDIHLNEAGHKRMAEELANFIRHIYHFSESF